MKAELRSDEPSTLKDYESRVLYAITVSYYMMIVILYAMQS